MSRRKTRSGMPSEPLTEPAAIRLDDDEAVGLAQIACAPKHNIWTGGHIRNWRDVAAAAGEIGARQDRGILVAGVAHLADAGLAAHLHALVILLQYEVDRTRDRVRAVDRRAAAGDQIDALDQVGRERVHVGRDGVAQQIAADVAAAVDEDQRALRAETAQIEQVEAARAEEARRILLAEGRAKLRQFVQHVADRDLAGLEELVACNGRDRRSRFEIGAADARAGDDDFAGGVVSRGRFGGGSGLRESRLWRDGKACTHHDECRQGRAGAEPAEFGTRNHDTPLCLMRPFPGAVGRSQGHPKRPRLTPSCCSVHLLASFTTRPDVR
jgi:hypothetical protein